MAYTTLQEYWPQLPATVPDPELCLSSCSLLFFPNL